ncbi:helix-turn-helix domain-containing protein [Burkholderia diffusa]|uniref:helix-turn-helix domain-containing protein n=1 Tax=Burkholderia diffusa TaxID=488732 RepID=UPI0018C8C389|nr:helix-turn-helix transcriptional regulator [Burkholderia diffusa]
MADQTVVEPDWLSLKTLAERLKAAREYRRLTQDELARRSGIRQGSISKIESGETREIRSANLEKLALALDVSPYWLMFGDSDGRGEVVAESSISAQDLLRFYQALKPRSRSMIEHLIVLLYLDDTGESSPSSSAKSIISLLRHPPKPQS